MNARAVLEEIFREKFDGEIIDWDESHDGIIRLQMQFVDKETNRLMTFKGAYVTELFEAVEKANLEHYVVADVELAVKVIKHHL